MQCIHVKNDQNGEDKPETEEQSNNDVNHQKKIKTVHDVSQLKEDDDKKKKERDHFERIVNAFRCYGDHYVGRHNKTLRYCLSMPEKHQQKLVAYQAHVESLRKCIQANVWVMNSILEEVSNMFGNFDLFNSNDNATVPQSPAKVLRKEIRPTALDMDKTASVLRQIVREWTKEGQKERDESFGPIIAAVEKYFGAKQPLIETRKDVKILVPGAGLGRLSFELASRGFSAQGNEFSTFMLFTSNFILNNCHSPNEYQFHPFVHQLNNVLDSKTQLTELSFPDVDPSQIPPGVDFSMSAGDFTDIYSDEEYRDYFNCVTTCFFIDTAHNVVEYLETLDKTLKPGGLWINVGPLLYHFSEMQGEQSIEPSYDQLRDIILSFGFEFLEEETDLSCSYTQNSHSMLSYIYKCVYFVCRKKILPQ